MKSLCFFVAQRGTLQVFEKRWMDSRQSTEEREDVVRETKGRELNEWQRNGDEGAGAEGAGPPSVELKEERENIW